MGDLKNPKWIYVKGFLFLLLGGLSVTGLLLQHPDLRTAGLLAAAVWAFSRFYYFAFYVIEHYVDPGYKFAGLGDFAVYLFRQRNRRAPRR
ncbi:MAG TPA: hypothetical protein VKW04_21150 [Planctomycetota bacterium]|nr:hypothetical protein [Planctomycetota bacterium]